MLEKVLTRLKNTPSIPGFAVGCVRQGQTLVEIYSGIANFEYDHAVTALTPFNVGSIAKQFTSAAVIILARHGKLNYSDELHKFFHVPAWARAITLSHLIYHTSGIKESEEHLANGPGYDLDNDGTYGRFLQLKKLGFVPGSEYLYSNIGYVLLAMVIEKVSGVSFTEFLKRNIFDPAGMEHTFLMDGKAKIIPRRAYGYSFDEMAYYGDEQISWETGDGGAYTTVQDLQSWDRVLHTEQILTDQEKSLMQTSGVLKNGEKSDYGFGLRIGTQKNKGIFYHSGGDAGFIAFMARKPATRSSIILLTNSGNLNKDEKKWERLKNSLLGILREL